jgi:hypothetical protein
MKIGQLLSACALVCCSLAVSGNPVDPDTPRETGAPEVDPEHETETDSEYESDSEQPREEGSTRPRPSTILNSAAAGVNAASSAPAAMEPGR